MKVKFCLFTDIHKDTAFNVGAEGRLAAILSRARAEKVDFVVQLGDFCRPSPENDAFRDTYNSFEIRHFHTLGNHDTDFHTVGEVVKYWGMPAEYYFFDINGYRFIVLNTNYFREVDEYIVHQRGERKPASRVPWLSAAELEWLRETVMSSPYPCVLFSHHSLELCTDNNVDEGLGNRREVAALFREAGRAGRRVLLCVNGHYHCEFLRVSEGVIYLDHNSASYDWIPYTHDRYPAALTDGYPLMNHVLVYRDPLSSVITIDDDLTVTVEGTESDYLYGVSLDSLGKPAFKHGRPCTASALSAKLRVYS